MSRPLGVFFLKSARVFWYLAAILIPLVLFPWTTDAFDFNKAFILTILTALIVISSLLGMIMTRSLQMKVHPVLLVPLAFLLFVALSSAFSVAPWTSWLGEGGQDHVSFLMTVLMTVLFFLGAIFFEDGELRKGMSAALMIGSASVGLLSLLTFFGFSLAPFQNTIGVPTAFAVYMFVSTMFGAAACLTESEEGDGARGMVFKIGLWITGITTLIVFVALDTMALWILVVLACVFLFSLVFARAELMKRPLRLVLPALFLLTAMIGFFVHSPLHGRYPLEVGLSGQSSVPVVRQTMLQHPLLGSGPGTFAIDYGLFSSPALNSSLFWDTRFSAAKSEFLTLLATHGVLGTALLLSLPIILLFFALKRVVSTRDDWRMVVPPFLGGLTLFIAFFLFVFTLTEVMLAVVFLAWAAALVLPPTRSISHSHSPRLALLSSFGTFVGVIGVLVATFLSFTRYGAELTFAKAVARSRENAPKADIISLVNSAATLNKYNDTYYRNLANILLLQTSELAADPKADPKAISGYLSASVNSAMRAVAIGPNTVMNWEMLGTVYREFSSVVTDANTHALEAYTQATLLSPSNPKYLVGLARVYLVRADMLTPRIQGSDKDEAAKAKDQQAEALLKAGEALKKAIALKSDYAAARYYAAFVEERKGNLSGAVQSMETARALSKNDIGVSIQLSLLYLRQGKNDLAAKELERAQTLDPKNDNVKWYLSVAYEAQGENDKAINLLQDLVKLYPENTTMKSRLEKLEKGEEPVVTPIPEPLEPTVPSTETVPVTPTP